MKRSGRKGHAVVEVSLVAPWIFFLFVGALNLGFFFYAFICTENAARVAAAYTSSSPSYAADAGGACLAALGELNRLPNTRTTSRCDSLPVIVTATQVTGPDGAPASHVVVRYQTVALIPMPGLNSQWTIRREVEMRLP
jgi:Flp pilus assembly protein TadG